MSSTPLPGDPDYVSRPLPPEQEARLEKVIDEALAERGAAFRVVFTEWRDGQLLKISEHGGSNDYAPLIPRAQEVAALLGITWSDDLIPDYVHEIIASVTDQ
jgi:hypothetical protein